MSFTPPVGSGLPFNLNGAYAPPAGSALNAELSRPSPDYVAVVGLGAGSFGSLGSRNSKATVAPSGTRFEAFGTAGAATAARVVLLQMSDGATYGTPRASLTRIVSPSGFTMEKFGIPADIVLAYYLPPPAASLAFNFKGVYSAPTGGNVPADFANTYVYRQLAPAGVPAGSFGAPEVTTTTQAAYPAGVASAAFGAPMAGIWVKPTQEASPVGLRPPDLSAPRIGGVLEGGLGDGFTIALTGIAEPGRTIEVQLDNLSVAFGINQWYSYSGVDGVVKYLATEGQTLNQVAEGLAAAIRAHTRNALTCVVSGDQVAVTYTSEFSLSVRIGQDGRAGQASAIITAAVAQAGTRAPTFVAAGKSRVFEEVYSVTLPDGSRSYQFGGNPPTPNQRPAGLSRMGAPGYSIPTGLVDRVRIRRRLKWSGQDFVTVVTSTSAHGAAGPDLFTHACLPPLRSAIAAYNSGKAAGDRIGLYPNGTTGTTQDNGWTDDWSVPITERWVLDTGFYTSPRRFVQFMASQYLDSTYVTLSDGFPEYRQGAATFGVTFPKTAWPGASTPQLLLDEDPYEWSVVMDIVDPSQAGNDNVAAYEGGYVFEWNRDGFTDDAGRTFPAAQPRIDAARPQTSEILISGKIVEGVTYTLTIGASTFTHTSTATSTARTIAEALAAQAQAAGKGTAGTSAGDLAKSYWSVRFTFPTAGLAVPASVTVGAAPEVMHVAVAGSFRKVQVGTTLFAGAQGSPRVWNYWQFVRSPKLPELASGEHVVQNWRRFVAPVGVDSLILGLTKLPNYNPRPTGVASSAVFGTPGVSPRTVRPVGLIATAFGLAQLKRNPAPVGFAATAWGDPFRVEFRVRSVVPGPLLGVFGQHAVFDAAQTVFAAPPEASTLFGDTRVKNSARAVAPSWPDPPEVLYYLTVQNQHRAVLPFGVQPHGTGLAAAKNAAFGAQPPGVDSFSLGSPVVGARVREVKQIGQVMLLAGTPEVANVARLVQPPSAAGQGIGQPATSHRVRSVVAGGLLSFRLTAPTVELGRRVAGGIGGSDSSAYGTTKVELGNRTVWAQDLDSAVFGNTTTWFARRTVSPPGLGQTLPGQFFGGHRVSDAVARVFPMALPAPAFPGEPTVARNETRLKPPSMLGALGTPDVQLGTRPMQLSGEELTAFGGPTVFNSRQYVAPYVDELATPLMGEVGEPWEVRNRNAVVRPQGLLSWRPSNAALVENTARLVAPHDGSDVAFGSAMVAARVRRVQAEGWEEFFSRYNEVHNHASLVEPTGISRPFPGVPRVWRIPSQPADFNNAYVGGTLFGDTYVGHRIRKVSFQDGGVTYGRVPDHSVLLYRRPVAPAGFAGGCGVPYIEHHRTEFVFHGAEYTRYGEAMVRNVTPQVYVGPWMDSEIGKPYTGHRVRTVSLADNSFQYTEIGKPLASFRTRRVTTFGRNHAVFSAYNDVRIDGPQLPAQQVVSARTDQDEDHLMRVGRPQVINMGVVFEGVPPGLRKFGQPTVTSNVVMMGPYILHLISQCGTPALNPPIVCSPLGIPPTSKLRAPTIFPLHIRFSEDFWGEAVFLQAIIDFVVLPEDSRIPMFTISNANRTIYMSGDAPGAYAQSMALYGEPLVAHRHRTIKAKGIGGKVGIPYLPSGNTVKPYWGRFTEEEVEGEGFDTAEYGLAAVGRPPIPWSPYVTPDSSVPLTEFGETRVELKDRTVTVAGVSSWRPAAPMVGYPREVGMVGTVMTQHGTQWISDSVRRIVPVGSDMTAYGYDPGSQTYEPTRVLRRPRATFEGIGPGAVSRQATVILPHPYAVAGMGDMSAFGKTRVGACSC